MFKLMLAVLLTASCGGTVPVIVAEAPPTSTLPPSTLHIVNPGEGIVPIDFELGNESGMHLNGRDAFLSLGRVVTNQDNDPRIQFFSGRRAPGDYSRSDDWDVAWTAPGHSFDGKGQGHMRLNGSTIMIRGPQSRYASWPGSNGQGNGGRYLVFQSCDDPHCSDDTDRTSFVGHLETGSLIFGTVQGKYDPQLESSLSHVVMRLTTEGLFPSDGTGGFADNYRSLGSEDYRWASVHAVDLQGGDIRFENGLAWTESEHLGVDLPPGIGLVSDRGGQSTLLMFIDVDGVMYVGAVKDLDDLHGVSVAPPETRLRVGA